MCTHLSLQCQRQIVKALGQAEVIGRLFLWLGAVSTRFQTFKLPENLAERVPIQGLAVCFDSLVTNLSVFKDIRSAIHRQHTKDPKDGHVYPALAVCCLIHQLALSRKATLMGFPGYWSAVVRLGHIFEVQSFRLQFRRALLSVVYDSFQYVAVPSLPNDYRTWRQERQRITGEISGAASRHNKKRFQIHASLSQWDNGCPQGDAITHWCTGNCCRGCDHASKKRFALLQCCRHLVMLFSFGFPIPLTYRWVHCHRALQYLQDACPGSGTKLLCSYSQSQSLVNQIISHQSYKSYII